MKALRPSLLHALDARRQHRVVRRREGQFVDDDQRQRLAAHIDALPEALAADQDGVAQPAKAFQQFVLAALALHQQRESRARRVPVVSCSSSCVRRMARSEVHRKKARPPLALSTGKAALTTASV
jgi:hypothetical protein